MRKLFRIMSKTIGILFVTGLFITMVVLGYIIAVIENTPKTNLNEFTYISETSFIYDAKDTLLDEVPTLEKRIKVDSEEIPDIVKNAFIAIEDKRFYSNSGIDIKRILGAVRSTILTKIRNKGNVEGGSTITQQLVKNVLLTPDRTIKRKIQEMVLATIVNEKMSKDDILTTYLNTIHLGGYAHGVELACNQYFNKSVKDINLIEAAFLAGITQSPNEYYPYSEKNIADPSIYLNRTETVLELMYQQGYLNDEEYSKAVSDLKEGKLTFAEPKELTYNLNYEWFNRELIESVKKDLMAKYNYTYSQVNTYIANSGLKIYSTMDKDLQRYAENIIYNADSYIDIQDIEDINGLNQPQIAAVVTDYKTGEVKAAVGGREPQSAFTLNRAVSSSFLKPTGSAVKPFTVYAPAVETGLYTPTSIVNDAPLSSSFLKKYNYNFQPQNDQLTYYGNITLQSALARSLNTIALSTVDKLGIDIARSYGELFGFKYNDDSSSSIAAIALGQFNNDPEDIDGANPMMVAEAFGTFGNGGTRTESILYTKVLDRNGNVILEKKPKTTKVITVNTAYTMFKMMEATLKVNTSNVALFDNMPIAGKSGTSENSENLWFGGLTPYYSAAVWVGSDNPHIITNKSGVPMYGNNTSGILWREIMKYAHRDSPYKDLEQPTIVETPVNHAKVTTELEYKETDTAKEQYDKAKKEEESKLQKEQQQREEANRLEEAKKKREEEEAKRKLEEEEARKKKEELKKKEEEQKKEEENNSNPPSTQTPPSGDSGNTEKPSENPSNEDITFN